MSQTLINDELVAIARRQLGKLAALDRPIKRAFVPVEASGPVSGAPPGADSAAGMMPPGADTAAGMLPPGADPSISAPPPGISRDEVQAMIQQAVQQGAGSAGAAGAAGAAGGALGPGGKPKMKVDVNTEIYHIKRLMVLLMNALGVQVPADALLGDPAEDPYASQEEAAADPASAAAAPGALQSAIRPVQPVRPAFPARPGGQPGGEKQSHAARLVDQGSVLPVAQDRSAAQMGDKAAALRQLIAQNQSR